MARYEQSYTGERRTEGLRLQLTPSQRQELEEAAAASGTHISEYARERLFRKGGLSPVAAGTRRNPDAKAILNELRRIGNNLNQLTHHANANDNLIEERRELVGTITQLKAAMARVIGL